MENFARLRILSVNFFNFVLFVQSNSDSATSDLKYHSHKPLNFSEKKIVTLLIKLLLLALVEDVFCAFKPSINLALFRILIVSLPELSTHFRPMFPFFTLMTHQKNKGVSAVLKGYRKGTFA